MKVLVLPGDGIGQEVTEAAVAVLKEVAPGIEVDYGLIGGSAFDETGMPLPDETVDKVKTCDAVLMGAVGGSKWDTLEHKLRPEAGLLGIRQVMGVYANLRPARVFKPLLASSTLKKEVIDGVDMLIVRELIGGIYFGEPRGIDRLDDGSYRGYNTLVYTSAEIERIARKAFTIALGRRKSLTSVDKANVLESSRLWREVVDEVSKDFPGVNLEHMYVDNCAMQIIREPKQFDVIVTQNLFGDILSDEASMITGSLGMLPSASMGETKALYEPVHGSAPDIAGKDIANPIGAILSAAMMLRYSFDMVEASQRIEKAVDNVLAKGIRTRDISYSAQEVVGTKRMTEYIIQEIREGN